MPAPMHVAANPGVTLPPATVPPASTYLSPYNVRVGPSTNGARAHRAGALFVPTATVAGGRPGTAGYDETGGADNEGNGGTDHEVEWAEDGRQEEVLNRSELKKMSMRLMRYRKRYVHIPGLAPLKHQAGDDGDGGGPDSGRSSEREAAPFSAQMSPARSPIRGPSASRLVSPAGNGGDRDGARHQHAHTQRPRSRATGWK